MILIFKLENEVVIRQMFNLAHLEYEIKKRRKDVISDEKHKPGHQVKGSNRQ